jgi:hypothetical protein
MVAHETMREQYLGQYYDIAVEFVVVYRIT